MIIAITCLGMQPSEGASAKSCARCGASSMGTPRERVIWDVRAEGLGVEGVLGVLVGTGREYA